MNFASSVISLYAGEKAASLEEVGIYTFLVDSRATKCDIVKFLESAYGSVKKINTITTKKKVKRKGKGKITSNLKVYKKAIVWFEMGKIDIMSPIIS